MTPPGPGAMLRPERPEGGVPGASAVFTIDTLGDGAADLECQARETASAFFGALRMDDLEIGDYRAELNAGSSHVHAVISVWLTRTAGGTLKSAAERRAVPAPLLAPPEPERYDISRPAAGQDAAELPGSGAVALMSAWGLTAAELEECARLKGAAFFGCGTGVLKLGSYEVKQNITSGLYAAEIPVYLTAGAGGTRQ